MRSRPRNRRRVGSAKPTILDVARRARVSKSLVSLVIRGDGRVSDESRRSVLKAAAELNYRPNAMARSLVQQRTLILGVLISDLSNPFFGEVVAGIQSKAHQLGYKVLFGTGDTKPELEVAAIDSLLELRVDGLILAGMRVARRHIAEAAEAVPVVVLNRRTGTLACDSVTNDDLAGAELAVEHCASLGHRRIAHIDGGRGAGANERARGYRRAMRRLGLEAYTRIARGAFSEGGGRRGAKELLTDPTRPTAIFAANDLCAIGALNVIEEAGLRIPEDMSLVGYDNTSIARLRHVSLTSVDQPAVDIGSMAVERLYERIEGDRTEPEHTVVQPSLVIRQTTSAPPDEVRG